MSKILQYQPLHVTDVQRDTDTLGDLHIISQENRFEDSCHHIQNSYHKSLRFI